MNKPKPKLLIAEPKDFTEEAEKLLKEYFEVTMREVNTAELKNSLKDYDAVWFRLGYRLSKDMINESTRCRMLIVPATGIDHIDEKACKEKMISIISLRGEAEFLKNIRATAELAIGLTISLLRNICGAGSSVVSGEWNRDLYRGCEIYGKTVGIIGMGRLGKITASYFKALGANVTGYDIKDNEFPQAVNRAASIKELIEGSDIVSVHVNYNDENENMIGKEELTYFKKNAVLINTSRGGLIDEAALLEALKNGKLKGAALDVLKNEDKINEQNGLIKYAKKNNNLLITPHIGGNTYESFEKTEIFIAGKAINKAKEIFS